MKRKVLVTGNLPEDCLLPLLARCDLDVHTLDRPLERGQLLERVADRDGLLSMITDNIDAEVLDRAPRLRMIANMAVGYNNIDVPAATARRIPVSNTPGVLTDTTADLAFALILAVARRVPEGDQMVRQGGFRFWAPFLFLGQEVTGATLGIVGLGRIGQALAERARGFRIKTLYHNRSRLPAQEEAKLGVIYRDLEDLLRESDFVSLHVPLTPDTRHLIGPKELALMKATAFLINTSRGPVVDEAALVRALQERQLGGAGLDVYEEEPNLSTGLASCENAVLLPHVGSATQGTRRRMAAMAVENLLAALEGQRPPNLLNPEVWGSCAHPE